MFVFTRTDTQSDSAGHSLGAVPGCPAGLAVESSEDSNDGDGDDNDDEDDEVEDSEGGEETCPPGCDPGLYDKVSA